MQAVVLAALVTAGVAQAVDGARPGGRASASSTRSTCRRASRSWSRWSAGRTSATPSRSTRRCSTRRAWWARPWRACCWPRWARPGCFWLNALSYVAVLASLARMDLPKREFFRRGPALGTGLAEGVRYAWATLPLRRLLLLLGVTAGIGFQYQLLLPVYARDILRAGPTGLRPAAHGLRRRRPAGRAAPHPAAGPPGAAPEPAAGARRLRRGARAVRLVARDPALAAAGALAGFGLIVYVGSTNTLLQLTTEDRYRGRVMSLYTLMFAGTTPIGALGAGAIAQRWGAPVATSVSGGIMLAGAALVAWRSSQVARVPAGGVVRAAQHRAAGVARAVRLRRRGWRPRAVAPARGRGARASPAAASPQSRARGRRGRRAARELRVAARVLERGQRPQRGHEHEQAVAHRARRDGVQVVGHAGQGGAGQRLEPPRQARPPPVAAGPARSPGTRPARGEPGGRHVAAPRRTSAGQSSRMFVSCSASPTSGASSSRRATAAASPPASRREQPREHHADAAGDDPAVVVQLGLVVEVGRAGRAVGGARGVAAHARRPWCARTRRRSRGRRRAGRARRASTRGSPATSSRSSQPGPAEARRAAARAPAPRRRPSPATASSSRPKRASISAAVPGQASSRVSAVRHSR